MDAIITATSGCRSLAWRWVVSVRSTELIGFAYDAQYCQKPILLFQFINLPHSNITQVYALQSSPGVQSSARLKEESFGAFPLNLQAPHSNKSMH
ncbi:hypothetical protein TorRG33x02_140170 [Trema orientale]|uniref:Uncharacterized protein n=1 Tax=Trema orientale TaxID=63057 RepID=A0A2P5EXA5_TREOI|nr:hypothetical protein TorRG33x02_140170 [Trema orientale]